METLKQLGTPQALCRTAESRPAWGVHRPSGLFIVTYFDTDDRLEAIEFGRPDGKDDAITYNGLDVFTTPAADLVTHCGTVLPSTSRKTSRPSPHPACFCSCGGRSRQSHQPTRKADSSKASSSHGLATNQPAEPGSPNRE